MRKIDTKYDVVVIGGGATGCGVALDFSSRGFKTLLLEKNDFASGTSGRSTKLLHGGVRYLEAAIKHLDIDQYKLVKDGLQERFLLIQNAPHLCHKISLLTPLYKWFEIPYVFTGLVIYDLLSGKKSLGRSKLLGKETSLKQFPLIKREGLKGCVKYFDGQFNDMRMNITIAKTAEKFGAKLINYAEVKDFAKKNGKIYGVVFYDRIEGKEKVVEADIVVNATGPCTDFIRKLDNPECDEIMEVSSGIHIVLDKKFAPGDSGLLIPKTEDGRVLFILPWENHCLIGTTDEPAVANEFPKPKEEEIDYLLRHINMYFDIKVDKQDIKSVWSGLRPLVKHSSENSTASIVRDHYIEVSESNLITVTGGKWTTFRKMAEDTVDKAISIFYPEKRIKCVTKDITYYGSEGYNEKFEVEFLKEGAFDKDILAHLIKSYGVKAKEIIEIAKSKDMGFRLSEKVPIIGAEVLYAIKNEFAVYPVDFIARRTSVAETDFELAKEILPAVIEIFAETFSWDNEKKQEMYEDTIKQLSREI